MDDTAKDGHGRGWSLLVLAALLALLVGAVPAGAAAADDADGDGVADAVDLCDDTPTGDLVDADGCSVCPCDETTAGDGWASHKAYVACVVTEARARRAAGTLARPAMRAVLRQARKSICGNAAMTRCCVYPENDTADELVGKCRITRVEECSHLEDTVDAEDIGQGSCLPNPCVW